MIDHPPRFQHYQEQAILQSTLIRLQFYSFSKNKKSRHIYAQEDFAAIIIQFIQSRSAVDSEWELIFSQVKFVERISKLVDDFLTGKTNFDHELIQSLTLKIDSVLDDYTNDFKVLGLGLSQEATSLAHKIGFGKMFDRLIAKQKSEAYSVRDLWEAKRSELLELFMSQLAPS